MISIGLVYAAIGILMKIVYKPVTYTPSRSVKRISTHFVMVGILNICCWVLGGLIPPFNLFTTLIGYGSTTILLLLAALELNQDYRRYRDKVEGK